MQKNQTEVSALMGPGRYWGRPIRLSAIGGCLPEKPPKIPKKVFCETCKKRPGTKRFDNGLACGTHCDTCFNKMVSDCRSRNW